MKKTQQESFPITSVSREDLEAEGFNTQNVSDEMMSQLASKMANAYVENSFWIDLGIIAEELGIRKHNAEALECVEGGCHELQGESEYCDKHAK